MLLRHDVKATIKAAELLEQPGVKMLEDDPLQEPMPAFSKKPAFVLAVLIYCLIAAFTLLLITACAGAIFMILRSILHLETRRSERAVPARRPLVL